ncbi:hypothetical protein J2T10_004109 [Paenarthrobacter nicotinovorans]|uniref:Uncharacterized protein n=1 Tax=Paenarthrobacter nicotinovorans TaxID=29320 RepID=A0ABT9TRY1_PAENI|nr:hypothetical protein [Paenarthrobacter nicotinovorans]MDQ0104434.1 hypothetical protein [Paenarthrobacter nicotinovorans]
MAEDVKGWTVPAAQLVRRRYEPSDVESIILTDPKTEEATERADEPEAA